MGLLPENGIWRPTHARLARETGARDNPAARKGAGSTLARFPEKRSNLNHSTIPYSGVYFHHCAPSDWWPGQSVTLKTSGSGAHLLAGVGHGLHRSSSQNQPSESADRDSPPRMRRSRQGLSTPRLTRPESGHRAQVGRTGQGPPQYASRARSAGE